MQPSLPQEARQAILLINEYAFELGRQAPTAQVVTWLETYRPSWIRDAVVEALHQGRYKIISVQQILALWQRRGQPVRHFTKEFERTIALPLGMQLTMSLPAPLASAADGTVAERTVNQGEAQAAAKAQAPAAVSTNGTARANGAGHPPAGLDDLSVWDEVAPPFTETIHTSRPARSGQDAVKPAAAAWTAPSKRSAGSTLSAIAADRGVLTSNHQPIQPFRPQLPFPRRRRY